MTTWQRGLTVVIAACIGLPAMLAPAAMATESRALFELNGTTLSEQDLTPALRQRLYDAYVRYRKSVDEVVRDAAFELHVEQAAAESGQSAVEVRSTLLPAAGPDDAALRQFYDQNRQRIRMPFEQVKGQIRDYLARQQGERARQQVVDGLRADGKLGYLLPAPSAPVIDIDTSGYPFKGPADAPVTLVEFHDYQCPHCRAAVTVVQEMVKRYGDKLRVVLVDFPINPSGISRLVAKGAVCAEQQGRFWDYHDLAFERQRSLTVSTPETLARELGLDADEFTQCYNSQASEGPVARAEAEAARLGVSSTPTMYVNGRRLQADGNLARSLDAAIASALGRATN
ncbi:MAG: thioredoxin domain-containing protein [Pseudomonadota bacterium]